MLKSDEELKKLTEALLNKVLTLLKKVLPATNLKQKVLADYSKNKLNELALLLKKNDPKQLIKDLKHFLASNWNTINGTSLSYTALATHEFTLLLCDVAQSIIDNSDEQTPILKLLMPTLALEGTRVGFISLDKLTVQQVQQVLKTHILGQQGKYLIPVSQLVSLQKTPSQQWGNGYYENSVHTEAMVNLNQEEYERLSRHSPETIAFVNAHKLYHLCLKQNDSLLAQLEQLCRSLFFNSNRGIGTDKTAGSGAYDAIIQFNEYYSKLDESIKKNIPTKVRTEIELLLNLSSDSKLNKNTVDTMGTCIATRRDDLIAAIIPVSNIIEKLGLSDDTKNALIEEKRKQLEVCEAALNNALQHPEYNGFDSLGLTRSLMKSLGIKYTIASKHDMNQLIQLTAEELNDLCEDPLVQKQLVHQFIDIETLIFFIHETPIAQLKVILTICGKALSKQLIHSPQDISALLSSMDKEYPALICSLLKMHLLPMIKSADHVNQLLENLSIEQRHALYVMMQDKIPTLINNVIDFALILHHLSPEQRNTVFLLIEKRLPDLVKNANDVLLVLHYLAPEHRNAVCLSIKDKIPKLINNVLDLVLVLRNLTPEQCDAVFLMMEDKILSLIKTADDVKSVLQHLSREQRSAVYQRIKAQLLSLIKQGGDVALIFECLSVEERNEVFLTIHDKIPNLITSTVDVKWILEYLTPEQRNSVYLLINYLFPALTKTFFDFHWLLRNLTPEQCSETCLAIKAKLPTLLIDPADEKVLFQTLSAEQRNAIDSIIKAQPPTSIKSVADFKLLWESTPPKHRHAICKAIKDQLCALGFPLMLGDLSPEQRTTVCVSIENLHTLIPTKEHSHFLKTYFPEPIQKKILLHHFFLCLLRDVHDKSKEFKDKGFIPAHDAAKDLFNALKKASTAYFGNDSTKPSINYAQFKNACENAISGAAELKKHRGWTEFFAQLLLGIVSLGTIPLALAVVNKIQTGSWRYSLYATQSKQKMDGIAEIVNECNVLPAAKLN